MKLSSTNLNNLIIVGAYWLYINTFFLIIPERENHIKLYEAFANVSNYIYIYKYLYIGNIQHNYKYYTLRWNHSRKDVSYFLHIPQTYIKKEG